MTSLDKGKIGKIYKIVAFEGEVFVLRRFFELGFLVGQNVKIVSMSLLKKAFLIEVKGYVLSVRADLLNRVLVEQA